MDTQIFQLNVFEEIFNLYSGSFHNRDSYESFFKLHEYAIHKYCSIDVLN